MAHVAIVVEEMGYAYYRQEIGYYLLLEKGVATRNYTLKATPAGGQVIWTRNFFHSSDCVTRIISSDTAYSSHE